jgi:cytochrome P450
MLNSIPSEVPKLTDISVETLISDPYPSFDRLRDLASVVWVESVRLNLVTRFDDIVTVERDQEVFASTNPQSLMNKVMGHSLMRKDSVCHQVERKAIEPAFRPSIAKNHWSPIFTDIAKNLIDDFAGQGKVDLFDGFSAPMASRALIEMLGFEGVSWQNLATWSQSLMDGVGNYQQDPEIETRWQIAAKGIDDAINHILPKHRAEKNTSVLSSMVHAQHPHSPEQISANVKVIVGGGLNEPRDAILTCIMGLLQNSDQAAAAMADRNYFAAAFEESIRWVSPIGMYPRRVTRDTVLGDTMLKEGDQVGICVGAANRDKTRFECPERFDINRPRAHHLAFGAGPHFCAGSWVSRQMVGEIAVPMIFDRLKNLRLDPAKPAVERGWVFRGPVSLSVVWDV